MKINWGTGIVLAFVAFISFILYFVYIALSDPRADHELVTEAYYSKDLGYQQDLTASANLDNFGGNVRILQDTKGLEIKFPPAMDPKDISGSVSMYRPSNENLDFELELTPSDSKFVIPAKYLVSGRWNINLKWTYQGKPYLYRSRLTY